jgi:hypothetical protein
MKKFTPIFIATILLCFSCENLMAQAPYKASVGGMLPSFLALGPSAKFFVGEHLALQTDLLYKATLTRYKKETDFFLALYPTIELNTNVMCQKKIKDKETFDLFWFIGGGGTLGFEFIGINGKFGVNAITGIEYVFKGGLSVQIDLRPGYAMLFHSGDKINSYFLIPDVNPCHHFDWLIGFTIRRTFNKKVVE